MSGTGEADGLRQDDAGMTLLEMLVVLGILALATGIVFPNLRRPYETLSAEAARAAVAADLRAARAAAIRTDHPVGFFIADDGRSYGYNGSRVLLPAAARLVSDDLPIMFAADGSSNGADLAVVQRNGRRLDFGVDAATGVVRTGRAR